MKNLIILFTVLSIISLTACQPIIDIKETDDMENTNNLVEDLPREANPKADPKQIEILANANRVFAFDFYKSLLNEDGNIIFSPYSLSIALSMTLGGAEGETQKEMLDTLQLTLENADIHPAFNALAMAIKTSQDEIPDIEGDAFVLNIANSIWGQDGFDFKESFLNKIANNYDAGIFNVDFKNNPELAREKINTWVEDETQGKIKDLIPPNAITEFTRLILANAIYFKGSWLNSFNKNLTQQGDFWTLSESQISVDMMKSLGNKFNYVQDGNIEAILLPYLSRDFAMTIILPKQGAFLSVEKELSTDLIDTLLGKMQPENVDLVMPKFDYETTINANDILKSLGMELAFNPEKSDFSGMSEEDRLYITDVLQKATITVDEEGTEAAAATAIIMGVKSMPIQEEPITLVIDRPFLFFISHLPTGSILFMGRVVEP